MVNSMFQVIKYIVHGLNENLHGLNDKDHGLNKNLHGLDEYSIP